MTKEQLVTVFREAGKVERCHALPHHGSYSVGQHSFDIATLILALHPAPTLNLIRAALLHDVPERWTGDTPAQAKQSCPELKGLLAEMDKKALAALGISLILTDEELRWLRGADQVEFLLWCKDQLAMGNRAVERMVHVQAQHLGSMNLPHELRAFLERHNWERISNTLPELST